MTKCLILLACVPLIGCVTSLGDSLEGAPEWFEDRRAELSGEDYPDIRSAAVLEAESDLAPWREIETTLNSALSDMETEDPGPVMLTAEQMLAWAKEQSALVAKGEEPY